MYLQLKATSHGPTFFSLQTESVASAVFATEIVNLRFSSLLAILKVDMASYGMLPITAVIGGIVYAKRPSTGAD